MAVHSYVKLWVHLIWTTHGRKRQLTSELRPKLFRHMLDYAQHEKLDFERINVQPEHVHVLINLASDTSVMTVAKKIKGESSHWINENRMTAGRFRWQRGYGAFSVSASQVELVKKYIENQEQHHLRHSFEEEYRDWLQNYGMEEVNR
ncbi:MAG: IS200/IS605 family transposase [SAR324 cluster bacterium]|nr:IS200/IS605 family transposase [SAR324 cluster bacterium]MBL7034361.1 IS200/IS605 family transposase [SAR324 cluster bacterium]